MQPADRRASPQAACSTDLPPPQTPPQAASLSLSMPDVSAVPDSIPIAMHESYPWGLVRLWAMPPSQCSADEARPGWCLSAAQGPSLSRSSPRCRALVSPSTADTPGAPASCGTHQSWWAARLSVTEHSSWGLHRSEGWSLIWSAGRLSLLRDVRVGGFLRAVG